METNPTLEAAAVTGRQQAFAMIASHCKYSQAVCLRDIHQSRAYEQYGLSWEQFCADHAGMSRSTAERIIERLEEFGESYFRLSAIARISPEAFREIAARITTETIELDGEQIPLTRENAQKIRAGIQRLRDECRRLNTRYRAGSDITEYKIRVDDVIKAVTRRAEIARAIPKDELAGLLSLADYVIAEWTQVADLLANA
jgi:hypothetical protein